MCHDIAKICNVFRMQGIHSFNDNYIIYFVVVNFIEKLTEITGLAIWT